MIHKENRFYLFIIGLSILGTVLLLEMSSNDIVIQTIGKQWIEYFGVACTIISMLLAIGAHARLKKEYEIINKSRTEAERRNIYFNSIENASNLIKEISSIEDYLEANNYDSAKSILPSIKRHFHRIASTIHANKSVLELLKNTKTYSYQIEFDKYSIDNTISIISEVKQNENPPKISKEQTENNESKIKSDQFESNPNFLEFYSVLIPRMEQFLSDLDTLLMDKINRQNVIEMSQQISASGREGRIEDLKEYNRFFTPQELKTITKNFQGICSFVIDFKTILKNNLT